MVKISSNYLLFEKKGLMGCSAVLRLDNISEAKVIEGDDGTQKLQLASVRASVSRGMPSFEFDSVTFEFKDMESRVRNFVAALYRAIRAQTHAELAAADLNNQAEDTGGPTISLWSSDDVCKMRAKTRLPMLEIFSPSAGAASLCTFKPGQQILSSKSKGGLPQLCCIWQGVAIGTMNGITVRRAEFGVSLPTRVCCTSLSGCFVLQFCA